MYLLGYIPAHNKIYLVDKEVNVYAYGLSLVVVEYRTAVLHGDMDAASERSQLSTRSRDSWRRKVNLF